MATAEQVPATANGSQLTPPKPERAPIIAGPRGLNLASFEDYWRFAQVLSASGLAPKGMENPNSILIALQMGAELGLPPMASVQNIAVINGRPSVWGDAMLAVCRASGLFDEEAFYEQVDGAGDKMSARVIVRRLPRGRAIEQEFSVEDAKRAGLWGKSGPWTQYPKRMLALRARSFALRNAFADVLRGFHVAEEVEDFVIDETPTRRAIPQAPVKQTLDSLSDQFSSPAAGEPGGTHAQQPQQHDEANQGEAPDDFDQRTEEEKADEALRLPAEHPLYELQAMLDVADTLGKVNQAQAAYKGPDSDQLLWSMVDKLAEARREKIRAGRGK